MKNKEGVSNETSPVSYVLEGEMREHRKKSIKKKISIILILLAIAILLLSTIFALLNLQNDRIIKNVKINGINVSNKTKKEVEDYLYNIYKANAEKKLSFVNEKNVELEDKISPTDINFRIKLSKAIDDSYNLGRNNNIFVNNFIILKQLFIEKNYELEYEYDENELIKKIQELDEKLENKLQEVSFSIVEDKLVILPGKSGNIINRELIQKNILKAFKENNFSNNIVVSQIFKNPNQIDIEKIYAQVKKNPENASFNETTKEIKKEQNGVDFAITIDEAKKILLEKKEQYEIPLKFIKPEITILSLENKIFRDVLGSNSTSFKTSGSNRRHNVMLTANKINGIVVNSGETFSFNKALNYSLVGYRIAGVFSGGKVVDEIGGGICQIPTTMYKAVMMANLEVVERHNHRFLPDYAELGLDATIYFHALDFRFKNTRKYPIKINIWTEGTTVYCNIVGLKEENESIVKIYSVKTGTTPIPVKYIDDPNMEEGKQVVVSGGFTGYTCNTFKERYLNGKLLDSKMITQDRYATLEKVVRRGTKKQEAPIPPIVPETQNTTTPQPSGTESSAP